MNKIYGNTVGMTTPRSDWNQTDDSKADYIKNKPELGKLASKDVVERTDLAEDVQASLDKVVDVDLSDYSTTEQMNAAIGIKANEVLETVEGTYAKQDDVYSKDEIDGAMNNKSDSDHNHDDRYYTETEIDVKVSEINTSISNIENGATAVAKANHAVSADSATTAVSAEKASQDDAGNIIKNIYETKADATSKLAEVKGYADSIKNDLLNGAGDAYDTLKELGDLIDDNADAIDALEAVATGKADKTHSHVIADVSGLQNALDGKAASSHGTHVSYSTTAPVMDGTASVGTASTVARSDHRHPTDTSRAAASELTSAISRIAALEDGTGLPSIDTATKAHKDGLDQNIADTYIKGLSVNGRTITYTKGDGDTGTITTQDTDTNTTYTLSKSGSTITLTGSDGKTSSVTDADTNTVYTHPTSSGNKHIPSGGSSGQILRWSADGTAAWGSDNNTTYGVVSTTADGLAPKRDGSTTKFLRADGTWAVPPDTNTTYNLGSFGITATAAELNYTDGVTSNIQTQLNSKSNTGHTHSKSQITDFPTSMPASDVYSWAKAASKPSYAWSEITSKPSTFTPSSHNHAASEITSGTLAVARGGTGVTSNPSMLVNLGSTSAASVFAASPRPGVTGTLPVANGGTGATTAAAARTNLGFTLANLGVTATATELNYTDGVTSNIQTQLNARKITWDCPTQVGSYSRLCHFDKNYASYLLTVRFYQTNQATCNTYLITQAHSRAKIVQLGGSAFIQNSDIQLRLIADSDNISVYVELLNNFSYDGSTTIIAHCSCTPLSDIGTCTRYTTYTPTTGGTVFDSITSIPSGIGGSLGEVVYEVDPETTNGIYCNGNMSADSVNSVTISDQWKKYKRLKIYARFPHGKCIQEFDIVTPNQGSNASYGDSSGSIVSFNSDNTSGVNNHYMVQINFCVKRNHPYWTFQVIESGWIHMGLPTVSTSHFTSNATTAITGTSYIKWNQRHNSDYCIYKIVGYED